MMEVSTDERLVLALGRIEHALSRLERAAEALPAAVAAESQDPLLTARHERLRATVEQAVARIDRLLDPQEE